MSNKLKRQVQDEIENNSVMDQRIKDWLEWDAYEPTYLTREEAWNMFGIEYKSR